VADVLVVVVILTLRAVVVVVMLGERHERSGEDAEKDE
jgi:hypothetical protein